MTNHTPKVLIVVLSWNGKDDTLGCLDSLSRLDYPNYGVIVVDNGSTDGTPAAVNTQFPNVHVIETGRNWGYAEGNNVGIRHALDARPDFVMLLNNDTIVDPQLLKHLMAAAQAHPDAGMLGAKIYWYSEPRRVWYGGSKWDPGVVGFHTLGDTEEPEHQEPGNAIDTDYACGCALLFRANVPSKIGLIDPRFFILWEETDWCYRARRAGYRIMIEPKAKVWHKVSQTFDGGGRGEKYVYYYSRNQLLWVEKNLRGEERLRCLVRCLRPLCRQALKLMRGKVPQEERAIIRARLLGAFHYVIRRFGPAPSFKRGVS